jgi:TadE-like protein
MSKSKSRQKGNSILEFALIAPFMVMAMLGVVGIGFTLGRAIQVNQVTRDTGHMFFDGVDFSQSANQNIVGRLAYGMGLASDAQGTINTSGNGVVILTEIINIGATECSNGGYATTAACPNYNHLVIEKRIVIGKSSLRTSAFGTPTATLLASDGSITAHDYCTDPSVVVPSTSTASSLNLTAGKYSFVVESLFITPALAGFFGNQAYSYVMM